MRWWYVRGRRAVLRRTRRHGSEGKFPECPELSGGLRAAPLPLASPVQARDDGAPLGTPLRQQDRKGETGAGRGSRIASLGPPPARPLALRRAGLRVNYLIPPTSPHLEPTRRYISGGGSRASSFFFFLSLLFRLLQLRGPLLVAPPRVWEQPFPLLYPLRACTP